MKNLNNVIILLFLILVLPGCKESIEALPSIGKPKADRLGPQAIQILQQGLGDPDPRIRTKAIEAVASAKQTQLMPKVQNLLRDDFVPVRCAAALAVGDTKYRLAKSHLDVLIKAPDENTRITAAYALYKLDYKDRIELIRKAATSPDQTVRANAVVLLGKSGDRRSLGLLYQAKDSEDSAAKVRFQAAEAIARLGDERIMPKLWTMIISKYVDNKIMGIRAMGALGTTEAKDVLLTKLDDEVLEVRLAAAEQLGALGDNSGTEQVLAVFTENLTAPLDAASRQRVRVLTALAIGRIGSPELTKYLPRLIEDESKQVRLAAAQAVLQLKSR